jgi:hypothetical protein
MQKELGGQREKNKSEFSIIKKKTAKEFLALQFPVGIKKLNYLKA